MAVAIPLAFQPDAWAADDSIDSWHADYVVHESGVIEVTEQIIYRFASPDTARGMQRQLMTREPYDAENDAVYGVTVLDVSSPDVPADLQTSPVNSGRERYLNLRIGDPNRTVGKPTGTYIIRYELTGALRTSGSYDEFYWDALTDLLPYTSDIQFTITVPGGVLDINCYCGPVRTSNPCDSASVDEQGRGVITQQAKATPDVLSFGIKIQPGLIADNVPRLEPKAEERTGSTVDQKSLGLITAIAAAATALVSGLVGGLVVRRRRDDRFAGVAPGNIPPDVANAQIVKEDGKTIIPVRFAPPDMPLAHAGFVKDGRLDPEDLSAVLVDMAVKGAIQLRMEPKGRRRSVVYVRPTDGGARSLEGYEQVVMDNIFAGQFVEVALADQGDLTRTFKELDRTVSAQCKRAGLIKRAAKSHVAKSQVISTSGASCGVLMLAPFAALNIAFAVPLLILPPIIIALAFAWVRHRSRGGTRTALGRAYADQVEGFREYIATAEADQLRFEEGEDIFSKYLPWAILFGETERWTRVCRELIDMGRLQPTVPYWYYGHDYNMATMHWSLMENALRSASTPPTPEPSMSSSSSGWGGGSSFGGGGGFSGGGGGGGGASSW